MKVGDTITLEEIRQAQQDLLRVGVHAAQARRLIRSLEEAKRMADEVIEGNWCDGFLPKKEPELEMLRLTIADATQRARRWAEQVEDVEKLMRRVTPEQRPVEPQ